MIPPYSTYHCVPSFKPGPLSVPSATSLSSLSSSDNFDLTLPNPMSDENRASSSGADVPVSQPGPSSSSSPAWPMDTDTDTETSPQQLGRQPRLASASLMPMPEHPNVSYSFPSASGKVTYIPLQHVQENKSDSEEDGDAHEQAYNRSLIGGGGGGVNSSFGRHPLLSLRVLEPTSCIPPFQGTRGRGGRGIWDDDDDYESYGRMRGGARVRPSWI